MPKPAIRYQDRLRLRQGVPVNDGDHAIVVAVIGMARAFGCVVTAEGVETQEQLETLKTLGCDHAQGFLLARPMPADELTALLVSESRLINQSSGHAYGDSAPSAYSRI